MKLGNNEQIVFSLMKKYPDLSNNHLQLLFRAVTSKKVRIDTILHSFEVKGITENGKFVAAESDEIDSMNLDIDEKILENIKYLKEPIKISKFARSILYLLYKTKKSSLQFMATLFSKPDRNIHAILQRLEEKNLAVGYTSRIRHTNSRGRRYRPKYYVLTDLGIFWIGIHLNEIPDKKRIDSLLESPQAEIEEMISKFDNTVT